MDKGVCGKGSIWNPSNCECECDKSYDVREYLDYENCQCRKKIADKLVEECTENIDAYFVYSRWYLKKDIPCVKFGNCTQTTILLLNL